MLLFDSIAHLALRFLSKLFAQLVGLPDFLFTWAHLAGERGAKFKYERERERERHSNMHRYYKYVYKYVYYVCTNAVVIG